jgi:DNA-binding SARP family transcriptional activator
MVTTQDSLRIYLTGRVALEYDGQLIEQSEFPGNQGVVAFTRLLLPREFAVSREELASVIWPEGTPRAWDVALNAIVSKLRVLLTRCGLDKRALEAALGCYQVKLPFGTWVDADAAFDALHEAEGLLRQQRYRDGYCVAQIAYHVCKRPFLPGETGAWVLQQRERFALGFARAGECLTEIYLWNREAAVAVDVAEQVLALHPLRETAYQLLMRAHAAAGNRGAALCAYERCRKMLSAELGVSVSARTSAVHMEILRGGSAPDRPYD